MVELGGKVTVIVVTADSVTPALPRGWLVRGGGLDSPSSIAPVKANRVGVVDTCDVLAQDAPALHSNRAQLRCRAEAT